MSIQQLQDSDRKKTWLNPRVNNLLYDGELIKGSSLKSLQDSVILEQTIHVVGGGDQVVNMYLSRVGNHVMCFVRPWEITPVAAAISFTFDLIIPPRFNITSLPARVAIVSMYAPHSASTTKVPYMLSINNEDISGAVMDLVLDTFPAELLYFEGFTISWITDQV